MPVLDERTLGALGCPTLTLDATGCVVEVAGPWPGATGPALAAAVGQPVGPALAGVQGARALADLAGSTWQDGRPVSFPLRWPELPEGPRSFRFTASRAPEGGATGGRVVLLGVEVPDAVAAAPGATGDSPRDHRIFQALLDASSDFIGIADPTGRPVWVNPAGRRMVGFAPDFDVGPTQIPDYYPPEHRDFVLETIVPTVMRQGHWKGETWFRHWQTQAPIPVSDEHFVIADPGTGEVLGLGTITRDISDLRRAREEVDAANQQLRAANEVISRLLEQSRALDRAKTEFFGNVSHELRTPLTLLLLPLEELLARPTLAPDLRERASQMHRNALRLARLVDNLLDFSRVEAGRLSARFSATDIGQATAEVASAFESAFASAGIGYRVALDTAGEVAWLDREKWDKIVMNLLSNALKYTLKGRVEVALRREGEAFELSVTDTGGGIPADQIPLLFERFHRVEGAPARSHEGAGIGLALARELARMHGGDITVDSEPGAGSRFTVSLPVGRDQLPPDRCVEGPPSAGPDAARRAAAAELATLQGGPVARSPEAGPLPPEVDPRDASMPTVLVVDDNADMRSYLAGALSGTCRVQVASDGIEALAIARELVPDLVLTDVMMPRLDGFGLVRALRADPSLRAVPIVLLSARAGPEASIEGLEAGADDYLAKPFHVMELRARVRTHIRMARARAELLGQLAHANRELEAFATRAAHDLRFPAAAVLGYGELLREDLGPGAPSAIRLYLDQIALAGQLMDALITDLLALSRVTQGALDRRPVDLTHVTRTILSELQGRSPEREVDLRVQEGLSAEADPGLVAVLMRNVLGNAWKYTSRKARATIEVGSTSVGGRRAFYVRDDGAGFEPQKVDRLFQPFQRLHRQDEFPGTGVGLATVRRIIQRHGGEIWAEGAVDQGATFYFVLDGQGAGA
ncbi:ATP-binding protein [Myxococcota bacterium]|nr:ATP-binding protein [Myxococcota bacterium]